MLEVRHVTKRFGGLVAVDDVAFQIAEREIVGIFGPNGSGKTTLMNVIAGVLPATRGEVRWKGRALGGLRTDEVAACGVVKTFQNPQLKVKARPRKDDSAEVYIGDEFLGIVFKDEDEGDYNFSMAILDVDLG